MEYLGLKGNWYYPNSGFGPTVKMTPGPSGNPLKESSDSWVENAELMISKLAFETRLLPRDRGELPLLSPAHPAVQEWMTVSRQMVVAHFGGQLRRAWALNWAFPGQIFSTWKCFGALDTNVVGKPPLFKMFNIKEVKDVGVKNVRTCVHRDVLSGLLLDNLCGLDN